MAKKYKKQVYLGCGPDGKQIRKWFYGDTKAELSQNILKYKIEAEKAPNTSDKTFLSFSAYWFDTFKANRSKQTCDMYRNALKKCEPLNPYPIKKITRSMCQQVIAQNWETPSSAKVIAGTLRQIFRAAIADGLIFQDPSANLTLPKRPPKKFHLPTAKELEAAKNADLSEKDRLFLTILQVFGLRPAEALALQVTDFDWNAKVLHITKALELTNDNQAKVKDTKTGAVREIPIPEALIAPLRRRIRAQHGFILFQRRDGGLYTKSAYRRLSERILGAINVQLGGSKTVNMIPDLTIYSFRHQRASELYYLTQEADPKLRISTKKAAYLMGHSEIIFIRTYSHIMEDREGQDVYSNVMLPAVQNL